MKKSQKKEDDDRKNVNKSKITFFVLRNLLFILSLVVAKEM
jgi:hypothetical protein